MKIGELQRINLPKEILDDFADDLTDLNLGKPKVQVHEGYPEGLYDDHHHVHHGGLVDGDGQTTSDMGNNYTGCEVHYHYHYY